MINEHQITTNILKKTCKYILVSEKFRSPQYHNTPCNWIFKPNKDSTQF